jgi:HK97 gp10 family phage protein
VTGNVVGLKELSDKLTRLETATAIKALRSAAFAATTLTKKKMEAAAPKGKKVHRTYKGRLVAPGFLSRSVIRKTRVDKRTGKVSVSIGVKREAFYGVTFFDKGAGKLKAHHWFKKVFEKDAPKIINTFKQKLAARIKRATA